MTLKQNIVIYEPKTQLKLFGYDNHFNSFKNLYEKNKLPNTVLLSGPKGSGKSTFAYHFINYLLSKNEENKYSVENFTINSNNLTFKLIQNNIHPNFFLLDKISSEDSIKIDQTRYLLKFLTKTNYYKDIKIILLDNAEFLNLNSSNALLKVLEEPSQNTFFFIIHNYSSKIIDTIKSRCVDFKFHFKISEKKKIFNKIIQDYELNYNDLNLDKFLYFDTPGNLLRYLSTLKDSNFNISKDILSCISFLIDQYKTNKDSDLLYFITSSIENFYNELSLNNSANINSYYFNKNKILYLINDMKNYHLDKRNLFFTIHTILKNEKQ